MHARRTLLPLLLVSLAAPLLAAPPAVKVEAYGNFSRSHYFRMEKTEDKQFVILSKFDDIEETRLPVIETKMTQMMPPIQRHVAKRGEQVVTVDIRSLISDMGGAAFTIELGDEAIRPIHLQAAPQITIVGRGYYNRSNYVRLETWKTKEGEQQYIVLYDFSSPTEIRLPVKSNTGQASGATQKTIRAEAKGRSVQLEWGAGRVARVQVDGEAFRPLILLDS